MQQCSPRERSGLTPPLSLLYDSGSGNGPLGLGWGLSIPSITRKTDKGLPQYDDEHESDVFVLSRAEDLVPEYEKDGVGNWLKGQDGNPLPNEELRDADGARYQVRRYRPRTEGLFARVERWTQGRQRRDSLALHLEGQRGRLLQVS